jgi:hypothetical protein
MEEKYIKFYKTFDKRFRNNKTLIHCINSVSNGGIKKDFLVGQEKIKFLQGSVKMSSTEQSKIFAILRARTVEGT